MVNVTQMWSSWIAFTPLLYTDNKYSAKIWHSKVVGRGFELNASDRTEQQTKISSFYLRVAICFKYSYKF